MNDEELLSRLKLSQLVEPGDQTIGKLLQRLTPAEIVSELDAGRSTAIGLGRLGTRWDASEVRLAAQEELDLAAKRGVRLIGPGDLRWPTQLDDLTCRQPLLLRAMGSLDLRTAAARSVAIVGARCATRYGVAVAEELAAELAALGWCVVSGAAFGIDVAAHRGALAAGGASIAVSAAGADRPSPGAHTSLFTRLYNEGVVVSEVPLRSHPTKTRFLVRNRLIAALTRCVVVVEAAVRSGARSTAREATELGRMVAAVPGPVTSAMSAGCHQMLRDGNAVLVTSATDIATLLSVGAAGSAESAPRTLSSTDEQVRAALQVERALAADDLAAIVGVPVAVVVSSLMILELGGLAIRTSEGWQRST